MNTDRIICSQIMDFIPKHIFNQCVRRYRGNYRLRTFSCFDQFLCMAFFVTRAKTNLDYTRISYRTVDKTTGLRSDQTIMLRGPRTSQNYPAPFRRISYYDADTNKRLVFITNNFTLDALTIAKLYKCRWQIELFFKWLKQHLHIKAFFGTSANAVKTQI